MQYIKLKSRGASVSFLQEILVDMGYEVTVSGYFDTMTDQSIRNFQKENLLIVDGEVGIKTWTILLGKAKPAEAFGDKFLSEKDLNEFSERYGLSLASVKAVNEVESSGKGFLIDGRPKILFEGHVFWRQLKDRGIDPREFSSPENDSVLYDKFTRANYLGGAREYDRMDSAAAISPDPKFKEAALSSSSWGSYQVMGYHAIPLGYGSVTQFVDEMYIHERNHLETFGRYILKYGCLEYLRKLDWSKFAKCYNGPAFAKNKYHEKMAKAFLKYS